MSDWTAIIKKVECPRCGVPTGENCDDISVSASKGVKKLHVPHIERLMAHKRTMEKPTPLKGRRDA